MMALAAVLYGAGHLMGPTIYDLLAWAALLALVLRTLRTGNDRQWAVAGVVAGFGLFDNTLMAFLLVALGVGVVFTGPRRVFASPWL